MINITTNQLVGICSVCSVITIASITGCVVLEKRRKEYNKDIEVSAKPWDAEWLKRKAITFKDPEAKPDEIKKQSEDPPSPVVLKEVKDQVDVVTQQSIDQLGARFALTTDRKYAIYSDLASLRLGEYDKITVDYWPEDLYFTYNGFPVPPKDIEDMFGRCFAEEVLVLGLGRDMSLLIFSTEVVPACAAFVKIVLNFHEGRPPVEIEEYMDYDPDDDFFGEPDEEPFDEEAQDEAAIQEVLDAEEIENTQPFFDPGAPIYIDPYGELSEVEIYDGWVEESWTFKRDTMLLYDENEMALSQDEVVAWLGLPLLQTICAKDVLTRFPERVIYVRNCPLKMLYEIEVV